MQGTITFFDKDNLKGSIQADDGRMVAFDKSSLASDQDLNQLQIDLRVDLELDNEGRACKLKPCSNQIILEDHIFYKCPSEIGLSQDTPEGFELIDCSPQEIELDTHTQIEAKRKFCKLASQFGANVVLGFKSEPYTKNSIGFSYQMFKSKAHFGLIGKKVSSDTNDEHTLSLYDLKHCLNHEAIIKRFKEDQSSKRNLNVLKIFGGVLLIIFCIGFLLSLAN